MPINDATGSFKHSTQNIEEVVSASGAQINSIVGSTNLSGAGGSYYGGGGAAAAADALFGNFVGMDTENLAVFNTACDTYVEQTQAIIQKFNDEADMAQALKGEVATAAHDFIEAGKVLLQKFVDSIRYEQQIVNEASQNWQAGAQSIASDTSSDAGTLESESNTLAGKLGNE